jgi:hypothetical protein
LKTFGSRKEANISVYLEETNSACIKCWWKFEQAHWQWPKFWTKTRREQGKERKRKMHTLEAFTAEVDLRLLLEAAKVGWDSFPSNEGTLGVPGGVRSLITYSIIFTNQTRWWHLTASLAVTKLIITIQYNSQ